MSVVRWLSMRWVGRMRRTEHLRWRKRNTLGSLNIRLLRFMPAAMNRTKLLYGWSVLTNGAVVGYLGYLGIHCLTSLGRTRASLRCCAS